MDMMILTAGPGGPTLPAGPGKPVAPYKHTHTNFTDNAIFTNSNSSKSYMLMGYLQEDQHHREHLWVQEDRKVPVDRYICKSKSNHNQS